MYVKSLNYNVLLQTNQCIYSLKIGNKQLFVLLLKGPNVTEMQNSNESAVPLLDFVSQCKVW